MISNKKSLINIGLLSTLSAVSLAAGGWIYATKYEPGWLELSSVSLILPNLSPSFDNYRIVLISDIHMGTWMNAKRLMEVVKMINLLNADLIAITGDFVTELNHRTADDLTQNLRKLRANDGVFSVLGNHDYWSNALSIRHLLELSGITELPNSVHTIHRGEAKLNIAGVDDYWENKARLLDVIGQIPSTGAAVLLAHEPDFAAISAKSGRFDLQLSGHTHGGQVTLPLLGPIVLPMYGRKYPAGLYQVDNMYLYTNRGLGTGRPQLRFNCRPEITILNLHASMVQ